MLGRREKIRLNPLENLHFTLINNEIGEAVDISDKGIKNNFALYSSAIKGMNSFDVDIMGPHLMSNFGIVLEVRTQSSEVLLFRQAAEKVLNAEKEANGINGFVPDIIHISLGYIVDASLSELKKIYDKLKEFREKTTPISIAASKVQTVKTINKAMHETGAIVQRLDPTTHTSIMEAI